MSADVSHPVCRELSPARDVQSEVVSLMSNTHCLGGLSQPMNGSNSPSDPHDTTAYNFE